MGAPETSMSAVVDGGRLGQAEVVLPRGRGRGQGPLLVAGVVAGGRVSVEGAMVPGPLVLVVGVGLGADGAGG